MCAGGGGQAADVLDLLARLVDKSLVVVDAGADGDGALPAAGDAAPVRRRSGCGEPARRRRVRDARTLAWYLALAEAAAPELPGPRRRAWLARLERGARQPARGAGLEPTEPGDAEAGLRLGGGLWRFWYMRSYFTEGTALARGSAVDTGRRSQQPREGRCSSARGQWRSRAASTARLKRCCVRAWRGTRS